MLVAKLRLEDPASYKNWLPCPRIGKFYEQACYLDSAGSEKPCFVTK
jgi:hypothetical protein